LPGIINSVAQNAVFSQYAGLLNGKTGITVLLYHYATYKNGQHDQDIAEQFLDNVTGELNLELTSDFASGLSGIAWGIRHLLSSGFIRARDDDIFEDIDAFIRQRNDAEKISSAGMEDASIGLYLLDCLQQEGKSPTTIWEERMSVFIQTVRHLLIRRYTYYAFPVFTCADLLPILHICAVLQNESLFRGDIRRLYDELPLIVKIAMREERNISDRYWLQCILQSTPLLITDKVLMNTWRPTLTDMNRFYLNRLLYGNIVPTPKVIDAAVPALVKDTKHMDELLSLLNPDNAGLGSYIGGLAWALLQWCADHQIEII
jgi:hypothetical protein